MRKTQENFLNYLSAVERVLQKIEAAGLELKIDLKSIKQLEASIRTRCCIPDDHMVAY